MSNLECKKRSSFMLKRKKNRNAAFCLCESWFPTDPLAAQQCKTAAAARLLTKHDVFPSTKQAYLNQFTSETQFMEDFGHDPLPENGVGIEGTQRYQRAQEQVQQQQQAADQAGQTNLIVWVVAGVVLLAGGYWAYRKFM